MNLLWCNAAAWTVAVLYGLWKVHQLRDGRQRMLLRQRVAYMLWVVADGADPIRPGSGEWRLTARSS
jgi:hypothetical protein